MGASVGIGNPSSVLERGDRFAKIKSLFASFQQRLGGLFRAGQTVGQRYQGFPVQGSKSIDTFADAQQGSL